jgi:hypothetical protein
VLQGAHDTPRNRSKKIENVVKVPRQPGKRVRHTSLPLRGWLSPNFNHVFPRQMRGHDPPVGVHAGRSRALQPGFGETSIKSKKSHGSATLPVTRPSQSCRFQSIVAKSHSYQQYEPVRLKSESFSFKTDTDSDNGTSRYRSAFGTKETSVLLWYYTFFRASPA